jgi:tRNA threonylcarbamoyladenosine biosynthesis protein TsaE
MICCLIERISNSPEETEAFGKSLAPFLRCGSVIAFRGGLGVGKTCLIKGIACGLGISETVTSPTFTLINEYSGCDGGKGSPPLYHIDAYRLADDDDFNNTGAGDCFERGIVVIEWSERLPRSIPDGAIKIEIEITGPQSRLIRMEGLETEP